MDIPAALEAARKADETPEAFCARLGISVGQYYLLLRGKKAGLKSLRALYRGGVLTKQEAVRALLGVA